ncbi:imidazole glycerol phosphate synthase subunit HisH [Bacillus lacus]|uniref:Imidazole glycerol phosphate synthase subunit HisH n=1 Tax=Metabacillus lacus TaxID=1983721 RepID=A0A7X2LYZ5_9BACI|nr:imidazole glycerol phosphate synthase subunit HisH [Metabacillus lacus]MRX72338.1 imidazole glycerol phosphate synthase subunit HisH [Metabacillus lacus]
MIGVIDYGMGNLYSVSKALERLDVPYFLSARRDELMKADGLLLPGVGSFKDAMLILDETGLADFIREWAEQGKPLLGICLGMQLLYENSEENGYSEGLRLLKGSVKKIPYQTEQGEALKVPHMGWNSLNFVNSSFLLDESADPYAYFVHSYFVDETERDAVFASADYGVSVPAVVGKKNVFGTQFHPEKSSSLGMRILKNYTNYVTGKVNS